MNSVQGVFAGLVLLIGFLPVTAQAQVVDPKAHTLTDSPSCSCRVVYLNSEKVAAALTPDSQMTEDIVNNKRGELLNWDDVENEYLLRVTRQDKNRPLGETHSFTHIWYVLEGSATLVSGGSLADPKTTREPIAPWGGQLIRGPGIEGGETRHVSKGDVIIVQRDTPHWWKEITKPPFIYLVVNIPPNSLEAGTSAALRPPPVTYFDSKRVEANFAKGSVLFDGEAVDKKYRVYTSRRGASSPPEVHILDTVIMYVVAGTVEYVTGGTVVNPKATEPDEIRGTSIEGGVTRELSKGDVIVVPNGVPHEFKEVRGPSLFYLVKVR